jgi:hypothetical protein
LVTRKSKKIWRCDTPSPQLASAVPQKPALCCTYPKHCLLSPLVPSQLAVRSILSFACTWEQVGLECCTTCQRWALNLTPALWSETWYTGPSPFGLLPAVLDLKRE